MTTKNGRVTLAILKNEIGHLKESQVEMKGDIKEIKNILINGNGKIAELKGSISGTKWVFGALIALLGIIITIIGAIK